MEKVESSRIALGFDPGSSGFITIRDGNKYFFYPMPTEKNEKGTSVFSSSGLKDLIIQIYSQFKGKKIIAGIEDVHSIPGSSAAASFNFGKNVGVQLMALQFLGAEIIPVSPKKWQADMWRGFEIKKIPSGSGKTMVNDTKGTSIGVAKTLFPEIDLRKSSRARTPDDNKVDSLLICEYIWRRYV